METFLDYLSMIVCCNSEMNGRKGHWFFLRMQELIHYNETCTRCRSSCQYGSLPEQLSMTCLQSRCQFNLQRRSTDATKTNNGYSTKSLSFAKKKSNKYTYQTFSQPLISAPVDPRPMFHCVYWLAIKSPFFKGCCTALWHQTWRHNFIW